MKRILTAYKDLLGIIFKEAPIMVVFTFICSVVSGLLTPAMIYVNQHIIDDGLAVANRTMTFARYSLYLVLFVIIALLPYIISGVIWNYVQPRSLLILRTSYKALMLKKLKTMRYEHFENETAAEIIDKAYYRAENSARHLWPMYVYRWLSSVIASIGSIAYIITIRWWLIFPV
ncbi:MAG: ABC transporter transmembrane domain-containing protein, partial [Bacilli bacterium]|nr:ABC transporter transmembrane domain-containing protein [Bacilli bacterium]